jgi:hypothetical protein
MLRVKNSQMKTAMTLNGGSPIQLMESSISYGTPSRHLSERKMVLW